MPHAFTGLLRSSNRARPDTLFVSQIWSVVVELSIQMNVLPVEALKDGSTSDFSDNCCPARMKLYYLI